MKIIASWFFILLILLLSNMKGIIVTYYQANKQYIVENFCENKSKPSLLCNGKCYLSKKIDAQKKQEEKKQIAFSVEEIADLFFFSSDFCFSKQEYLIADNPNFFYVIKDYSSKAPKFFQPPC